MKIRPKSFRIKLWIYFVLFTALIFSLLWLLQTVFLQSFYNDMLINNTKQAAASISESFNDDDFSNIIDELSLSNSILVYITDTDGSILYSSDQFKGLTGRSHPMPTDKTEETEVGFGKHSQRGGKGHEYRSLPDGYSDFLSSLEASDSGTYESTTDGMYVYGAYLGTGDDKKVLYISTTLDAVGPAVDIIRMQLIWGTVISVIIASVLAWFIARGFAMPVAKLTNKAEHIGSDDFPEDFRKGFCSELDELSDVLDETSDKLKKSRNFQRELLANVSHDLRTPDTMIKGYAEMVRDISRTDEEQCNADIEVIVRESDRLCAMVNEILEFSEMQSAEVRPEPEDVDISAVVRRVCSNFNSLYSREGGRIDTQLQENVIVKGDAGRLERAVYNLLDNAVRHNGESKVINVTLTQEGGNAKISITDHGSGIPAQELENIWDRYYTYRSRNKKGVSGLGLAIVKEIVKMHGGICTAESTVGIGSTFIIKSPV